MNDAIIQQLKERVSVPRLDEPAPDQSTLQEVYQCALRAPDHMMLRPWRYLIVEGDARKKLGELFCKSAEQAEGPLTELQQEKYRGMPMRAPMMLICVSTNQEHPKVPVLEQQLSCGVGIGYMLLALQSSGFNGIWRTGTMAENGYLKSALGIAEHESIIGFLYIGTPVGETKPVPDLNVDDYFMRWE